MIRKMLFSFLPFLIVMLAVLGLASFTVLKAAVAFGVLAPGASYTVIVWVFFLLPILLVLTMLMGTRIHNKILSFVYIVSAIWLAILLYFFLATVFISIIFLILTALGISASLAPLAMFTICATGIAILYGVINAANIRHIRYDVTSSALAPHWKNKNIVLVSDIHLGTVRNKYFMDRIVSKINALKPDLVLIAGDIIDGPAFNYERGLRSLANITSTHGIMYTPGNHEQHNHEPHKFYPIIRSLTTTLIDEKIEINGTQIIGLDYKVESHIDTKARLLKAGYEKGKPSIILLHDPKNTLALCEEEVSLVVSGHTHLGQFFPINMIVKRMYKKFAYGINALEGTTSITSSGAGTAMSPLRLGTNPEIVLITIQE